MVKLAGRRLRQGMCGAAAAVILQFTGADPAAASVTIRDLVGLTDIDGLSVSPDGRFAIFRTEQADIARNSYELTWFSIDLGSGTVREIGSGGDPIYADPGLLQPEKILWGADNRTIVVRELRDEAVGLWRGDVAGDAMTPLVSGDADVLDYSVTPDRSGILYETGATRAEIRRAEQREYDSGILVDSTVDLSQNLFHGGSINGRMASQRLVGYWWVRDGLLWRAARQQHRVTLATGMDRAVGGPKPVPPFSLSQYLKPDSAANEEGDVATAAADQDRSSISVRLTNGRTLSCPDALCRSSAVSWLGWRPASHDLIIAFKDRAFRQSLYRWDTDRDRLTFVAASQGLLGGGRNDFVPCAISPTAAVCVESGPASPPELVEINLSTGARKTLFDPNARLRAAYASKVRFLRWNIGGGLEAGGVLLEPERTLTRPAPLYLNYNRCEGFLRGGEGNEWPIPQLLDAGFRVACVNAVPLNGPQNAVRNYRVGLAAVRSLVGSLVKQGKVDRTRVAMGGLSFGSEVAFWVAAHSNLLAALSVSSAQWEPAAYWLSSMPQSDIPATIGKVWGLGAPDRTARRWRTVSPAFNTARIRIPVLFQTPEQEARRLPELYARLYSEGTPVELYAFPDEGHIKIQPRHRLAVYERNLDWFRYWLEDYRDPDPSKIEEYHRWDLLRARWRKARDAAGAIEATTRARPSRSAEAAQFPSSRFRL